MRDDDKGKLTKEEEVFYDRLCFFADSFVSHFLQRPDLLGLLVHVTYYRKSTDTRITIVYDYNELIESPQPLYLAPGMSMITFRGSEKPKEV
jgi:hypothetical protein